MITVCDKDNCSGCKLCSDICPTKAITIDESIKAYNAIIDEAKCIKCSLCRKLCSQNNAPGLTSPIDWYQGWSLNPDIRANSSSGGLAAEISKNFIKHGGEVLTCQFKDGKFSFGFFDNVEQVYTTAGSKYVKSNPVGVYKPLLDKLNAGKKVMMIALPCQIAAAKAYTKDHENFYTVDLICHGTPSPKVLEYYLKGKDINISEIDSIRFRQKANFGLSDGYKAIYKFGTDAYMYAFLNSISYTENCYFCKYAKPERISDLTLGDSWGSELSRDEQKKGISLILCQTSKGRDLLDMSHIELKQVDPEKAVAANEQLKRPSLKHKKREYLMDNIEKGKDFEKIMFRIDPKRTVKNIVKTIIGKNFHSGGVLLNSKVYSMIWQRLYTYNAALYVLI